MPLEPRSQRLITAIANAAPTACGGGVYYYAGKELEAGLANGFAGTITEIDSRAGISKGALFEAGVGEGVVVGVGKFATTNAEGQLADADFGYGGAGFHSGVASGGAGMVGFTSGVGVFVEGFLFGRGGGVGAYVNITNNATCKQERH